MTDYEKTLKFFKELGLKPRTSTYRNTLRLFLGEGDRLVTGYSGFYSVFYFNPKGKFEKVGIYD